MTRAASDVTKLLPLFLAQARGNLTRIISSQGTLAGVESVTAPVDSTAQRLVVVVNTAAANAVAVRRPNGVVVAAGDPDANIATVQDFVQSPSGGFILTRGTVVTINAPAIGAWRIELTGGGAFAVSASAKQSARAAALRDCRTERRHPRRLLPDRRTAARGGDGDG